MHDTMTAADSYTGWRWQGSTWQQVCTAPDVRTCWDRLFSDSRKGVRAVTRSDRHPDGIRSREHSRPPACQRRAS